MPKSQLFILTISILIVVVGGLIWINSQRQRATQISSAASASGSPLATPQPNASSGSGDSPDNIAASAMANASPVANQTPKATSGGNYVEPIAEFQSRITKKTFGMYIDPKTSPVQPERFQGYHTGDDVEYQDVTGDVPVRAIADGTVVISRRASGYGGVIMIEHKQVTATGSSSNTLTFTSIYGHLQVSSLVPVGTKVTAGQQIAILGANKSADTDGERKHLHFGILKGSSRDLRGYVQNKSELSIWYDPLVFLNHP